MRLPSGDTSPVPWDGGNWVSANYRMNYAPRSTAPGATWYCKNMIFLAGLQKQF